MKALLLGRSRHTRAIVLAIMVAALATACGSDGNSKSVGETPTTLDGLVSAAKDEGKLVWYSSMDESLTKDVAKAFEKQYDIDVEYVRLVTTDLLQRYAAEAESDSVTADVVMASHGTWGSDLEKKGVLVDIRAAKIPDVDNFPAELYEDSVAEVGAEARGVAINTDRVSPADEPKDWTDLGDPKWKGKILLLDPTASVAGPLAWKLIEEKYGAELLKKIGANVKLTSPGMIPMFEQLAAGEGAIGLPGLASVTNALAAKGAPLKHIPFDFAPIFYHSLGISADAPHPNAARLFAHWMMVGEGQTLSNDPEKYGRCSPVTHKGCPANPVPQRLEDVKYGPEIFKLLGVSR